MKIAYSPRVILRSLRTQFIILGLQFYAVPLPAVLKVSEEISYLVNMLLIINPAVCFIVNIVYCLRNPFLWYAPLICGLFFAPTVPLYYNATAWPYTLFYVILAYIGAGVGVSINRNQKKEEDENDGVV